MQLEDKQKLVTQYFSLLHNESELCDKFILFIEKRRESYIDESTEEEIRSLEEAVRMGNDSEYIDNVMKQIKSLKNQIKKEVEPNEIHALINHAYDAVYSDHSLKKNAANYFIAGVKDLLKVMYQKDMNYTVNKAMKYTALSWIAIVTIPFTQIIYNQLFKYFYYKQSIQQTINEDMLRKINHKYQDEYGESTILGASTKALLKQLRFKCEPCYKNEAYLKKNDFFNENGEIYQTISASSIHTKITQTFLSYLMNLIQINLHSDNLNYVEFVNNNLILHNTFATKEQLKQSELTSNNYFSPMTR